MTSFPQSKDKWTPLKKKENPTGDSALERVIKVRFDLAGLMSLDC